MMFPLISPDGANWTTRHQVAFAKEGVPTACWADRTDNINSACYQPGTGRLGLCPEHELSILGDPLPDMTNR